MNVSQAIVTRVIELCKERDLSINAMSNLSGITQSTVNSIVNGETHSTGIATIKKLCDGLNIPLREFFDSDLFDDLEPEVK